jgi:hypothetical protein
MTGRKRNGLVVKQILDLDKKETWHEDFSLIFKDRTLSENEVKARSLQVLENNYSFVAGYHACRTASPNLYKKRGVCPSNPSEIISIARELFKGIPGLDQVLSPANHESLCFERSSGCVGVLLSGEWALNAVSHYFKGSERLQTIAAQLKSEDANVRLKESGPATLISFKIPLEWLSEMVSDDLSVYTRGLGVLLRNDCFRGGGFLLRRAIPPEYITRIENVEEKVRSRSPIIS